MIELIFQLLIFAISLVVLASASHFTIKSIEKLIELTGLSEASTGFVILAVMTSTPEIIVALFSVLQGNPGISVGDIVGSNVIQRGGSSGHTGNAWLSQNMLHRPCGRANRPPFHHFPNPFGSCYIQLSAN